MTASGVKVVDANVWLALAFEGHVHHVIAVNWFAIQVPDTCAFTRLTQLALLRHLTNSKIMGPHVQSQKKAWQAFDELSADPRVVYLPEPPGVEPEFRGLTQVESPSRDRWSDAYLAALAKLLPAQVTTFDQGFSRFPGLSVEMLK